MVALKFSLQKSLIKGFGHILLLLGLVLMVRNTFGLIFVSLLEWELGFHA